MAKKAASAPAPEPAAQKEQQPAAPAPEPVAPAAGDPPPDPPAPPTPPAPVAVEPLATYAARIEELAQPLAVCQITHPDAVHGAIHVGKYAGIRLVKGDKPKAVVSDGSTL
jgi:hypothetical protein